YRNAAGLPKSNEISKPNCAPSDRRAGAVQPLKCQRSNALARSACRRLRSSGTVRGNSAGLTIGQRTGLDHASGHRGDELAGVGMLRVAIDVARSLTLHDAPALHDGKAGPAMARGSPVAR